MCAAPFDAAWAQALPEGADVTLPPGTYAGPWLLAKRVRLRGSGAMLLPGDGGATLEILAEALIDGLAVVAADGGVGVRVGSGAEVELRGVSVSGPAQTLVYVKENGALTLSGGELAGGDYGLLTERARRLRVQNVTVRQQKRTGLAIVNGPGELIDNALVGPFGEAAILLLHGSWSLSRNLVSSAGSMGIKILNGAATLVGDRIAGGRSDPRGLEGDGLYLYSAQVTATGLRVADCQGPAISLRGSTVALEGVVLEDLTEGAVYVSDSTLRAKGCIIRRSPGGLLLEPGAKTDATGFTFEHVTNPVVRLDP